MLAPTLRSSTVATAALLMSWAAMPAEAQESAGEAASEGKPRFEASAPNGWEFTVAPYAWLTAVSGDMTVKGANAPIDASIGDVLSHTNIAAMVQFDVRKGDLGGFVNIVYADLGASNMAGPFQVPTEGGIVDVPPVKVDTSLTLFTTDVGLYYRTVDLKMNGGVAEGGSRLIVEPYAGARIWYLDSEIRIPGRSNVFKQTSSDSWADAIVGFRSQWEITKNWNASLIADIGGFAGGSTFTANGILLGGYRFDLFAEGDSNVFVGYRVLYDDYTTGSGSDEVHLDMALHGPILGLAVKF